MKRIIRFVRKRFPSLTLFIEILVGRKYPVLLDYPLNCIPRYGYGKPPHEKLFSLIGKNKEYYRKLLEELSEYRDAFQAIPQSGQHENLEPILHNDFLPVFDAFTLYSLLGKNNPSNFYEVGSGHSTRFARRAISDFKLRTRITSIDPSPRSEIDKICDTVIRKPVEVLDVRMFENLGPGDILFIDNSHRVFQNSDSTVCFLDILPVLESQVLVHFHDITLPWDYSYEYGAERYYSEQYLLAAYILAEGRKFQILMPNYFVTHDDKFKNTLEKLQVQPAHGSSFWIKMN